LAKWYVYILRSLKDGGYYIGYTSDLEKRLRFHNRGLQRSTRHRRPFELVYFEEHTSKRDAIKREKELKSYKGGEALKRLLRRSPASGGTPGSGPGGPGFKSRRPDLATVRYFFGI